MTYRCESCPATEVCKRTFGRYWAARSDGGTGCDRMPSWFRRDGAAPSPSPDAGARRKGKLIQEELV